MLRYADDLVFLVEDEMDAEETRRLHKKEETSSK